MKKASTIFVAMMLLITTTVFSPYSVSANAILKDRKDFEWGIGGHNSGYAAYPERTYKEQVRLAAQMGCDIYRINYNPTTMSMLNYLDKIVAEVHAYGMDVMLVMDDTSGTPQDVANRARIVAGRYKKGSEYGFIKYIQIFGEVDVVALEQSGTTYKYDGSKAEHYSPEVINDWYLKFDAAIKMIRSVNPDAKTIISFSYVHYGFLLALQAKGLKWDIIGPDWYEDMGSFKKLLDPLKVAFPGYKFIICESNIIDNKDNSNANISRWQWLLNSMDYCYNDDRIIGFLFYELLDELTIADNANIEQREAHFGFVACSRDGRIGEPKAIFYEVQRLLGGNPNVKPVYNASSTSSSKATTRKASATTTKGIITTTQPNITTSSSERSTTSSESTVMSASESETSTSTKEAIDDKDTKKSNIVPIVIGVVIVVLLIGGIGTFLFLKKKTA